MADKLKAPESIFDLPATLVTQMLSLATSGFGVVVALAWNEVIKSSIETYVKPYLGQGSGVASLLIYAIVVTALSVIVTMHLSFIQKTVETKVGNRAEQKKKPIIKKIVLKKVDKKAVESKKKASSKKSPTKKRKA